MKRILKSRILAFILGGVILGGIGVYASNQILASDVDYKDGKKVSQALDELYSRTSTKKFCVLLSEQYGTKGNVGAKYACNLGDGEIRNFYLLKVDGNNVKLIMERNLTDTVGSARINGYQAAKDYLKSGGTGYSTISTWTNVGVENVDLPSAQDIVDASLVINPKENWSFDISTASATTWCLGSHEQEQNCPTSTSQTKISWLFNYLIGCSSSGCSNSMPETNSYAFAYWTKDLVADNSNRAWNVFRGGRLGNDLVTDAGYGVRPVITISKSNLSE